MNWMLTVNVLILLLITGTLVAGIFILRRLRRDIVGFITPPADNEPSPLAQVVDSVSDRLAKRMAVEVKTTLMGMLSGQARQEQSVNNANQIVDLAAESPGFAGLIDMLPKDFRKKAMRNPAIVKLIMSKLGAGGAPKAPVESGIASGNGSRPKFNL